MAEATDAASVHADVRAHLRATHRARTGDNLGVRAAREESPTPALRSHIPRASEHNGRRKRLRSETSRRSAVTFRTRASTTAAESDCGAKRPGAPEPLSARERA
ncbi:hypothetical protein GCM10017690_05470 [Microbacterium terregens]